VEVAVRETSTRITAITRVNRDFCIANSFRQ
jgi:hypothetical protein